LTRRAKVDKPDEDAHPTQLLDDELNNIRKMKQRLRIKPASTS
jgi:hypothetical protein